MPTYSSQLLIDHLQQQTESFINLAISEWQLMPHTRFAMRPGEGKWSANECLQHLNSYCNIYLPAIEQKIKENKGNQVATPIFKAGWLGGYFTQMMMPAPEGMPMKKVKAMKGHIPESILESHAVISDFIDYREKTLQLLEMAREVNLGSIRVPTSISNLIQLKLGDTFNFLIAHQYRHILQAQRALGIYQSTLRDDFLVSAIRS